MALLAENEIVADDHMARAQAAHQDLVDKGVGGPARHLRIEGQDEQEVYPHLLELARLAAERCQAKRSVIGLEIAARMRFEREDGQRRAGLLRDRAGPVDDGAMPPMNAIEVAHNDHGAAGFILVFLEMPV